MSNASCVHCGTPITDLGNMDCPSCGNPWQPVGNPAPSGGGAQPAPAANGAGVKRQGVSLGWVVLIVALLLCLCIPLTWMLATESISLGMDDGTFNIKFGEGAREAEEGLIWELEGTVPNTTVEYRASRARNVFECRTGPTANWQMFVLSDVMYTLEMNPDLTVCGARFSSPQQ